MSFIKENDLVNADDVYTKSKLIKLRLNGEFKENVDWVLKESPSGRKAVWWTQEGYDRLMQLKDLKNEPPVLQNKKLTGVVQRKFVNKNIVECLIDGLDSLQVVKVKDSTHLRVKSVIPVVLKKHGWVSNFKTDLRGKISA